MLLKENDSYPQSTWSMVGLQDFETCTMKGFCVFIVGLWKPWMIYNGDDLEQRILFKKILQSLRDVLLYTVILRH